MIKKVILMVLFAAMMSVLIAGYSTYYEIELVGNFWAITGYKLLWGIYGMVLITIWRGEI